MKKCVQLLTIFLFVTFFAAGYAYTQYIPAVDHFKVYEVNELGSDWIVNLHDQFDDAGIRDTVMLDMISFFANPVNKNGEGILDNRSHLVWYHIAPLAPDPTRYWVNVRNQFLGQRLWLGPAQYLLVPAEKNGGGFPDTLDHYEAYPVISGKAINKIVDLDDQFGFENVEVKQPVWFCNPVSKNGEEIRHIVDHLVFYDFDPHTGYDPAILITALDQFGVRELTVTKSLWLGVPSIKTGWDEWTEDDAVELGTFEATKYGDRIEVAWTTASEIESGGFNIHRSLDADGPYARINDALIPSKGNELEGASYSFVDRDVADGLGYYYQLESIDLSGEGTMHGPVFAAGDGESPIPAAFRLAQNNPNPFNPITEIMYDLPVDCQVSLVVYNVLGQRVATLVNEFQKAGSRIATWDSRSDNGVRVSSGIYFYKLYAGTFVETRKMVLLR